MSAIAEVQPHPPLVPPLARLPLVRLKYGSVPEDVGARLRSFNPRTDVGLLIRECLRYLPRDLAEELIHFYCGQVVVTSSLELIAIRRDPNGGPERREDYGVVSRHVVTDTGVKNIVDVWNSGGVALNLWKYIGIGTGSTAELAAQTALITELTTEYNPDGTRCTGVISQPSNNVARVVGTNTIDSGSPVLRETGLFSQATVGGVMWDRFLYGAITLVGANGDGLQSTINSTFTSGG